VESVSERLFRSFYAERLDTQAFIGLLRRFAKQKDSHQQRIHQQVIRLLVDEIDSLPCWPEKELLRTSELLGQLIRWDLILDGWRLKHVLLRILSALREPVTSLLHRFGQLALQQFRCRLASTEVGMQLTRHMIQPSHRIEEQTREQEERRKKPVQKQQISATSPPWHLIQNSQLGQQQLMRVVSTQVCQVPLGSVPSTISQGSHRPGVTWMLSENPKAMPRPATKQGKTNKKAAKKKNNSNQASCLSAPKADQFPTFFEVEIDSMKFHLTEDDVQAITPSAWEPSADENFTGTRPQS